MIVKDGGATLGRCLGCVAGVVDRIIVGDTGSTDDSARIARSFGAKVVRVPWDDDFAQARNAVLRHTKCDWVLVLDADEMLDEDAGEALYAAIARTDVFAYTMEVWNYVAQSSARLGEHGARVNPGRLETSVTYPAYVPSTGARLFRRHHGVVFERPVHESVMPRVGALRLKTAHAGFAIHHFGLVEDAAAERARKDELYQELATAHLRAHPTDARTCFELGVGELEHFHRPEAGLKYFERAVRLAPVDAASWVLRGVALARLQRYDEAVEVLRHAATLDETNIVVAETMGDAHFHRKRYADAAIQYQRASDLGSASMLTRAKLGATLVHLGYKLEGMELVNTALGAEPEFVELHDLGTAAAMLAGATTRAAQLAVRRLMLGKVEAFHYVLAGTLCVAANERVGARAVLEKGRGLFPADAEIWRAIERLGPEEPMRVLRGGKLLTLPVGGAGRSPSRGKKLSLSSLPSRRKGSPRPEAPSRA